VNGSDSNNGTQSSPLLTISAALERTRGSGSPNPTIMLMEGSFYLTDAIRLTPADSGLTVRATPPHALSSLPATGANIALTGCAVP
jgi:hypothetical protein